MLQNNPYIEAIVQQRAGGGGRPASTRCSRRAGAMAAAPIKARSPTAYQNIGNQFRGREYENERARQMAAAGAISQEQLGRMGIQGNAAQGVGGLQTAGAQGLGGLGPELDEQLAECAERRRRASATKASRTSFGRWASSATCRTTRCSTPTSRRQVGEQVDTATQAQINDLINQWTQGDMSDWSRAGRAAVGRHRLGRQLRHRSRHHQASLAARLGHRSSAAC